MAKPKVDKELDQYRACLVTSDAARDLGMRGRLQYLPNRNGSNISKSARETGIERAYLQRLIGKYDLR